MGFPNFYYICDEPEYLAFLKKGAEILFENTTFHPKEQDPDVLISPGEVPEEMIQWLRMDYSGMCGIDVKFIEPFRLGGIEPNTNGQNMANIPYAGTRPERRLDDISLMTIENAIYIIHLGTFLRSSLPKKDK